MFISKFLKDTSDSFIFVLKSTYLYKNKCQITLIKAFLYRYILIQYMQIATYVYVCFTFPQRCIKILSINVGHSYLFIQTTHDIQPCSLDYKDQFVIH